MAEPKKYYRFRAQQVAEMNDDEYGTLRFARIEIYLDVFQVVKTTPKGVWISLFPSGWSKRFILNTSKRKYAWPTKEEALESLKARLNRQNAILLQQSHDNAEKRRKVALINLDDYANR